jgi:enolase
MNTGIRKIIGRRIWDSRGRPTVEVDVEVDVELAGGAWGRGIAPAGASRGSNEAIDLRDGGSVLAGFGVQRALRNVNEIIAPALAGMDALDQDAVDERLIALDGTPNKSHGGNATIATSMAVLNAVAAAAGVPL